MRILVALAIFSAAALGQGKSTALLLTIRPECGILESSYSVRPGAAESVLRFRYAARAGTSGGKLYMSLGLAGGEVRIRTTIEGPVKVVGEQMANSNTNVLLAEIFPNGRTQKSGHIGEINLLWPNADSAASGPRLIMTCH